MLYIYIHILATFKPEEPYSLVQKELEARGPGGDNSVVDKSTMTKVTPNSVSQDDSLAPSEVTTEETGTSEEASQTGTSEETSQTGAGDSSKHRIVTNERRGDKMYHLETG